MSQEKIGLLTLRLGLALVYIYFGVSQLMDVSAWSRAIPEWAISITSLSAPTLVKANAIFELVLASLLALGIWSRIISFVLAAHLALITFIMGFTPTGVRDFGLTVATLAHGLMEKK